LVAPRSGRPGLRSVPPVAQNAPLTLSSPHQTFRFGERNWSTCRVPAPGPLPAGYRSTAGLLLLPLLQPPTKPPASSDSAGDSTEQVQPSGNVIKHRVPWSTQPPWAIAEK